LKLTDGRIRTLPGVIHILGLERNFIFVIKMYDERVKLVFKKETCRMVQGEMVLLKGVWFETLYKLQGRNISDGCNSSIVLEIGVEEGKNPIVSREKIVLWYQRLGHIKEKGLQLLHVKAIVEGMSNYSLEFNLCEHCVYGK
jgi:hypothetical protein